MAVITWVDEACKAWGRCTRWMLADTGEGYPSMDVIAKARDGLLNIRASGIAAQKFGEVRVGDALEVARAMRGDPEAGVPNMPIELTATMFAQYVVRSKINFRIDAVGELLRVELSRTRYFEYVDGAHYFLMARIQTPDAEKPSGRNLPRPTRLTA